MTRFLAACRSRMWRDHRLEDVGVLVRPLGDEVAALARLAIDRRVRPVDSGQREGRQPRERQVGGALAPIPPA